MTDADAAAQQAAYERFARSVEGGPSEYQRALGLVHRTREIDRQIERASQAVNNAPSEVDRRRRITRLDFLERQQHELYAQLDAYPVSLQLHLSSIPDR